MKKVFVLSAFVLATVTGFAQDKKEATQETSVKIELAEADAEKAKSLKGLEHGKLTKGIDRTTFIISTSESDTKALEKELKAIFPSIKMEVVKD